MTTGGATKCSFRLAVQRRFTNQQTGQREADFIPIVAWRQTGELCAKYLTKGRKCAVCGSIQTRSYDAKDGSKRYVTEIIADEVEFLERAGQNADRGHQAPPPPEPAFGNSGLGFGDTVEDDELPF